MLCRIGPNVSAASVEPDGRLRCVSPGLPPGRAAVSVALNGQQFEGGFPLWIYAAPTLHNLLPEMEYRFRVCAGGFATFPWDGCTQS